jgi:hypothetical protein
VQVDAKRRNPTAHTVSKDAPLATHDTRVRREVDTSLGRGADFIPRRDPIDQFVEDLRDGWVMPDRMSKVLNLILSHGAIEHDRWNGAGSLMKKLPPPPRTVFDHRLKRPEVPFALIEDGYPLTENQLRQLMTVYGKCEHRPEARRRLEAVLARIKLGKTAESDKRRYAEMVLQSEKQRLRLTAIDESTVDKLARIFRMGGLTAESKRSFLELLSKQSISGAAKLIADKLKAEAVVGEHAAWTFFVHINAHGSLGVEALLDLEEMELIGSIPGKINVVALVSSDDVGRTEETRAGIRLLHLCKGPGRGLQLVSNECAIDPHSPLAKYLNHPDASADMRDPLLLRAAIEHVKKEFPSDHLLVNLWGHEANAARDSSAPAREGGILPQDKWKTAFEGLGVDVLACDACCMGTFESALAAERAGIGHYLGSQFIVDGEGWRYDTVLSRAEERIDGENNLSPREFSRLITDHFVELRGSYVNFSAVKLETFRAVKNKLDNLAKIMVEAGGLTENCELGTCWNEALRPRPDFVDIGDLALQIARRSKGQLREAALELLFALDGACYQRRNPDEPEEELKRTTGLSVYAPREEISPHYQKKDAAWCNGPWMALLATLRAPQLSARAI